MGRPTQARSLAVFGLIALVLIAIKLYLTGAQALFASTGGHDDFLFLSRADSILAGDWLGPYNSRILIKGPLYSLWIASTSALGLPLLQAQQVLYVLACLAIVGALSPALRSAAGRLVLFAILLFQPASSTTTFTTRLVRDNLQSPLVLLLFAAALLWISSLRTRGWGIWGWPPVLGLIGAALSLNREDGVWVFAGLVPLMVAGVWSSAAGRRTLRRSLILAAGLGLLTYFGARGAVRWANHHHYGRAVITEPTSRHFVSAYGALTRIQVDRRPYVPVSRAARLRAYSVSPSFAELERDLEGRQSAMWRASSCRKVEVCDDLGGGWFLWAFRAAAARARHHRDATTADAYYRQIASDINTACETGSISCGGPRATLRPPLSAADLVRLPERVVDAWAFLSASRKLHFGLQDSRGKPERLLRFSLLTHEPLAFRPRRKRGTLIAGWAASPEGPVALEVRDCEGKVTPATTEFQPSKGLAATLASEGKSWPHAARGRFQVWVPEGPVCSIAFLAADRQKAVLEVDRRARTIQSDDLYVVLSPTIPSLENWRVTGKEIEQLRDVQRGIRDIYSAAGPIVGLSALVVWMIWGALNLRRGSFDLAWAIPTSLLLGLLALLSLIALVDLTSFPAIRPRNLAPGYPLFWTFCVVTLWTGTGRIMAALRRPSSRHKALPADD